MDDSHPSSNCNENQNLDSPMERNHQTHNEEDSNQIPYVLDEFEMDHTQIIRGSFHQGDERFSEFSRNKQSLAVSVVSLCFLKANGDPSTWKTADVDIIVAYGDAQYNASYKQMKRERIAPKTNHLLLSEVYPFIKLGREFYYLNEFDANQSNFESNALKTANLLDSLNQYFTENRNQTAIFTYNDYSFAIIRNTGSYFVFNSLATSYTGEPMNPAEENSAACLAQFFTIQSLANYIFKACSRREIVDSDSGEALLVFYLLMNVIIEKKVFAKDITARQRVTRDLCTVESKKFKFLRKRKNSASEFDCTKSKRYRLDSEEFKKTEDEKVCHGTQIAQQTIVAMDEKSQVITSVTGSE